MILEMSFQEFMIIFREFVFRALPGIILFVVILVTWLLSRFAAKYGEQKNILNKLPEIMRQEITQRDDLIKELQGRVEELESQRQLRINSLKAAYVMAGKVQEIVMASTNGVKQITE
jgi:hypothetical protein